MRFCPAVTINAPISTTKRASAIARGASEWRDRASDVRAQARAALLGDMWPAQTVEMALDNVLWDLDEARVAELIGRIDPMRARPQEAGATFLNVLVILPGNVIGPAIQAAYCAAIAGANVTLKPAQGERHLAEIVSRQFDRLGAGLTGSVRAVYWPGGETTMEASAFEWAHRIIAFGEDATIDQIRSRAPDDVEVVGYGESYSVGFVHAEADLAQAAARSALDICLFDQRGCMSPQTVYVGGDRGRALLFARTLAQKMQDLARTLPRAAFAPGEREMIASAARRLAATALEPMPHGLDTLIQGPQRESVPEFIVAVEPFGPPTFTGFGRIAIVKPCPGAREVAAQIKHGGSVLDTVGLSVGTDERDRSALRLAKAKRLCELGEMQRPPLGYRPSVEDFARSKNAPRQ